MQFGQSTVLVLLIAAAALAACAAPPSQYVVADDEMLCRHAAGEPGSQPYRECRNRLIGQRSLAAAAGATQIETPHPNVVALIRPTPHAVPAGVAVCRDGAPHACPPAAGDITGSVPAPPKTPQP